MFFRNLKEEFLRLIQQKKGQETVLAGLDISPDSFKLLEINTSRSPYRIEKFAQAAVPPSTIIKDEIKNAAVMSRVLNNLLQQCEISTTSVAIAIPRSLVLIKNIMIDGRLTKDEIESRAWLEANRHFPDLAGDIYLDFSIGKALSANNSQVELTLVACRKDRIDPYLTVLAENGFTVKVVEVDSYALERALSMTIAKSPQLSTVGLLNLNTQLSSFIVMHDKNLIHAHDQTYNGQRLLSQFQQYLKNKGILNTETDKVTLDDADYNAILKENLISHLRHTMHFFYSSRPNVNIQQIQLSGDCARVPHVQSFIQREMGVETLIADPFEGMEFGSQVNQKEFKEYSPALVLSGGLALGKIDAFK